MFRKTRFLGEAPGTRSPSAAEGILAFQWNSSQKLPGTSVASLGWKKGRKEVVDSLGSLSTSSSHLHSHPQKPRQRHPVPDLPRLHPRHPHRSGPLPAPAQGPQPADDRGVPRQQQEAVQPRCAGVSVPLPTHGPGSHRTQGREQDPWSLGPFAVS